MTAAVKEICNHRAVADRSRSGLIQLGRRPVSSRSAWGTAKAAASAPTCHRPRPRVRTTPTTSNPNPLSSRLHGLPLAMELLSAKAMSQSGFCCPSEVSAVLVVCARTGMKSHSVVPRTSR